MPLFPAGMGRNSCVDDYDDGDDNEIFYSTKSLLQKVSENRRGNAGIWWRRLRRAPQKAARPKAAGRPGPRVSSEAGVQGPNSNMIFLRAVRNSFVPGRLLTRVLGR